MYWTFLNQFDEFFWPTLASSIHSLYCNPATTVMHAARCQLHKMNRKNCKWPFGELSVHRLPNSTPNLVESQKLFINLYKDQHLTSPYYNCFSSGRKCELTNIISFILSQFTLRIWKSRSNLQKTHKTEFGSRKSISNCNREKLWFKVKGIIIDHLPSSLFDLG